MLEVIQRGALAFLAACWVIGIVVMTWRILRAQPKVKPLDVIHRVPDAAPTRLPLRGPAFPHKPLPPRRR